MMFHLDRKSSYKFDWDLSSYQTSMRQFKFEWRRSKFSDLQHTSSTFVIPVMCKLIKYMQFMEDLKIVFNYLIRLKIMLFYFNVSVVSLRYAYIKYSWTWKALLSVDNDILLEISKYSRKILESVCFSRVIVIAHVCWNNRRRVISKYDVQIYEFSASIVTWK